MIPNHGEINDKKNLRGLKKGNIYEMSRRLWSSLNQELQLEKGNKLKCTRNNKVYGCHVVNERNKYYF